VLSWAESRSFYRSSSLCFSFLVVIIGISHLSTLLEGSLRVGFAGFCSVKNCVTRGLHCA
jgi:hypothetical protein